ncbi:glucose-1-phosphate thymidylyltransferase [Tepidiforma sp.]|uniref:glucose-1-phosphate thymidylyltransferase n=1 Tax=Tepidiforma sp. TaxID=2682230 RepID=UPI00263450D7|nr:glucose-1-phosphate thymidylyltransferase [Tepidiforma sp.]MCX7617869.1 glucose-1-phosphate thymidylyltransferase [Tepidiforma sp.]
MKGIVLAGGKGSRLRPFTYSGAKQLVPIANTPVLHFPVRQLAEAGVREIALVVGETEAQVREAMGDGSAFGVRFTYVRQEAPLGIAHGALVCREFVGDEPFVLYLGDNVLMGGIAGFVERFGRAGADGAVILREVADPRAFGVARMAGERLAEVVEKPAEPPSNLAVIGVYAFRPVVFDVIAAQRPSARGELEIADAINGLLARGCRVEVEVTPREWIDTGKMEDILAANRLLLGTVERQIAPGAVVAGSRVEGAVVIEAGARVEGSELIGPAVIGAGAEVVDSRVGPFAAVGERTRVVRSRVEDAIVMSDSEVADCPGVAHSMLGRHVRVAGAPAGARLTLGDHSRVERDG